MCAAIGCVNEVTTGIYCERCSCLPSGFIEDDISFDDEPVIAESVIEIDGTDADNMLDYEHTAVWRKLPINWRIISSLVIVVSILAFIVYRVTSHQPMMAVW